MGYNVDEFSICLKKGAGSNGYLIWGPDGEADMKEDEVVVAEVKGKHHWATSLNKVGFGELTENKSDDICARGCAAIIDSGTSLIAAPSAALAKLSDQVGTIKPDCSNIHELPDLHFTLDGKEIVLPPEAYVMRIKGVSVEADNIWDLLFFKPKLRTNDNCMPAFMAIDMRTKLGDVWILGMPFFRYFHTTFNREKGTMTFAKAGEDCEAEPMNKKDEEEVSLMKKKNKDLSTVLTIDPKMLLPPRLGLSLLGNSNATWVDL